MQNRTLISETIHKIGQEITLAGWVQTRRDHGKLIFIDLRDHTGIVQIVINPKVSPDAHNIGSELRSEYIVTITGKVNERPEELVNPNLPTGTVEIEAVEVKIL